MFECEVHFKMRIGVIGGGSIGLLLSSYLCKQHDVTLYVRREKQKEILNNQGLFLSDITSPFSIDTLLLEEIKKEDCLMICVKQHQIEKVMPILKDVDIHTSLIFLQNGMGHLEHLEELHHHLYVGVIEHGALRKSENHVVHTGKGRIALAKYNSYAKNLNFLTEQLHQEKFPFEVVLDWEKLLVEKLIVNAVINPLTTLFNVPNKEILNNPHIYFLAEKLCREAALILQLDYRTQLKRVKEIANQTGENSSSMLTDIKMGRQTEIEAISGYLIRKSANEIPFTSFVYQSIKALENKTRIGQKNG